jgi:hypothetical protein
MVGSVQVCYPGPVIHLELKLVSTYIFCLSMTISVHAELFLLLLNTYHFIVCQCN